MRPRSVVDIALRPKNDGLSYFFMSLKTGRSIHERQQTVKHVTESVIYQVEKLAANKGINEMVDREMLF